ncbi:sugar ABC transporter permease [Candidatus Pelagibacter sp.]|jgi:multiple sugar transport system permease protein|nr:sugar ABC transporter permease [Candidatus Pelagibacter sp.]MDC1114593.1 sugar ABC transporter permease [Candidatus Pelagibacter sp.]
MPNKSFFWFFLPTGLAMILFIGLPIISTGIQSFYSQHDQILKEVKKCDPFGCVVSVQIDQEETLKIKKEKPLGKFNGFGTYVDRNHLAFDELSALWKESNSIGEFIGKVTNLPFYKALIFTLTYCIIVTPCVLLLGFIIALSLNAVSRKIRGPLIFGTILPMIVTPLVGSLVLFWMVDAEGIIGANLQILMNDPYLSVKSSKSLTWITIIIYGIWHHSPFAFVVFYAALQTVPQEPLEASIIDGASRFQRVRHIVLPHIYPVVTFVALISLMDNFRVFEPIIGFSAQGSAQSLSWLIYDNLVNEEVILFGSAAATSIMTIIGIAIILAPVLIRTWREFRTVR